MENVKPGTATSKITTDDDKIITIHTVRMSEETKSKGFKGFKRSKGKKSVTDTKPGISKSQRVKDGNKTGTLKTTIVPIRVCQRVMKTTY